MNWKTIKYLILITCVIVEIKMDAQDIHSSLYWITPSNINGALINSNPHKSTLGLSHRNQYYSIAANFYQRNSLTFDHSFNRKWTVGLNYHHSRLGKTGFRKNTIQLISAHRLINYKVFNLDIGIRGGIGSFKLNDVSQLIQESTLIQDESELLPTRQRYSYRWGGSFMSTYFMNKSYLQFGLHARQRVISSMVDQNKYSDLLYNIYSSWHNELSPNFAYSLSMNNQMIDDQYEHQFQFLVHPNWNKWRFNVGVGTRLKESVQFILGCKFRNTELNVAYDQVISSLKAAAHNLSTIEIGLRYSFDSKSKKVNTLSKISYLTPELMKSDKTNLETEAFATPSKFIITPHVSELDKKKQIPRIDDTIDNITNKIIDSIGISKQVEIPYDSIVIFHAFDSININGENQIESLCLLLKKHPNFRVTITSHTDQSGTHQYNDYLSQKRAEFVRQLMLNNGIDHERLIIRWKGERNPLIDCRRKHCTPNERAKNRRTVILFEASKN